MSTKTTLKRIALVAVSALGAGMLSIFSMPAANATSAVSSVTIGAIPTVRAGGTVVVPVTVNLSTNDGSDTLTVAVKTLSAPLTGGVANGQSGFNSTSGLQDSAADAILAFTDAGGSLLGTPVYTATTQGDVTDDTSYVGAVCSGTTAGDLAASATSCVAAAAVQDATSATTTTLSYTYYVRIKPDLAGTYSFLVSASADTNGDNLSFVSGDKSASFSLTTVGAPSTVSLSSVGGATSSTGTYGALVKVIVKDSSGNTTQLIGSEELSISTSEGVIVKAGVSGSNFTAGSFGTDTSATLGSADFINGMAFVNVKDDNTAATTTMLVTATGSAALSPSVTGTVSISSYIADAVDPSSDYVHSVATDGTPNTASDVAGTYQASSSTVHISSTATSLTLEFAISGESLNDPLSIDFVDTLGHISGAPGTSNTIGFSAGVLNSAAANTEMTKTITFANPPLAAATSAFTFQASGESLETVSFAASAVTYGDLTVTPSSVRLAELGSTTFTASYTDQFGFAKSNVAVTVSVAGRNSAKSASVIVTDADGNISYSFTDTGSSGTSDIVTFNAGSTPATTTSTITYGTATAGSVLVVTPNTAGFTSTAPAAGAEELTKDPEDIDAGSAGGPSVSTARQTVTALVKDAAGNVMAGMPVTWTISGTGCDIVSTTKTGYTDAEGKDSASVYAWLEGSCTVTATSGGKSDDAITHWAQEGGESEVRSISATVSGNLITATVKDRFGNPMNNIPVYVTRTSGTGYFGSSTNTNANTGLNGQVSFVVTGGPVTATVGFANANYGQTDAPAGLISSATVATSNTFTAYTAGTALTAEVGVGQTFSAAGVNSVSVEVTADDASVAASKAAQASADAATDAAAEAIDAANAATDAANLAAEAADAATVAAEEARDAADAATAAVEELATQVATLMAALKAQITTLANTVAKIAKKVKA